MEIDQRILDYGEQYLLRRLPLVQLADVETVRNVVIDLMFMGKYFKPVESARATGDQS